MEPIFLTCMVIAFFMTKGKVDTAAYKAGHEPAGVARARMRHETGGGARSEKGRPKGKGAFRLMMADRWANACESARQRSAHKAERQRAWFNEVAPTKDEKWREKKLQRLAKADVARDRWARARGLLSPNAIRARKAEDDAWKENKRRDAEAAAADPAADATPTEGAPTKEEGEKAGAGKTAEDNGVNDASVTGQPAAADAQDTGEKAGAVGDGGTSGASTRDKPATEPDAGCSWIPAGKSEPCGKPRHTASYCVEHHIIGRLNECAWGKNNPADGRCPNRAAPHQFYCEAHLAEDAKRAKAIAEAPPAGNPAAKADEQAEAAEKKTSSGTSSTQKAAAETKGTATVYQQAVERLIAAADRAAEYRADLGAFADTLAGKKWGPQVTGEIQDMAVELTALEGEYRDLAARMKTAGDAGAAAHDLAPWVPADDSILV